MQPDDAEITMSEMVLPSDLAARVAPWSARDSKPHMDAERLRECGRVPTGLGGRVRQFIARLLPGRSKASKHSAWSWLALSEKASDTKVQAMLHRLRLQEKEVQRIEIEQIVDRRLQQLGVVSANTKAPSEPAAMRPDGAQP